MSAYIVSDTTIHSILRYAKHQRFTSICVENMIYDISNEEDVNLLGQMLVDQNYRSVNFRYKQNDPAPKFQYSRSWSTGITAIEFLKCLSCLEYQSCETDDWLQTPAYQLINVLMRRSFRLLAGYEDAPWGLVN